MKEESIKKIKQELEETLKEPPPIELGDYFRELAEVMELFIDTEKDNSSLNAQAAIAFMVGYRMSTKMVLEKIKKLE